MAKEELATTGVLAGVGHRKAAGLVLTAVDFAIDLVARSPGARRPFGPFPGVGAAALGHETVDYPVKGETVVEALINQFHAFLQCVSCIVAIRLIWWAKL